jgi:hypothetical protein
VTEPDRYPCATTVFCDVCGIEHTGDYIVSDEIDGPTRLGYARKHVATLGWSCSRAGDFCPACLAAGNRKSPPTGAARSTS